MISRRWWLLAPAAVSLLTALPAASQDPRAAGRLGPDAVSAADLAEVRARWLPALVLQERLVGQLDQLDALVRFVGETDDYESAIGFPDDLHDRMVEEIQRAGPSALGASASTALLSELNVWFEEARRQAAAKVSGRIRSKMARARGESASPAAPDHAAVRRSAEELDHRFVTIRARLEDGAWRAQTAVDGALTAAIARLDEKRQDPRSP
jgi:hypothetical protein